MRQTAAAAASHMAALRFRVRLLCIGALTGHHSRTAIRGIGQAKQSQCCLWWRQCSGEAPGLHSQQERTKRPREDQQALAS